MIFLDTSGILALAMEIDSLHAKAFEMMETAALIQSRIGKDAAVIFLERAALFDIVWVDSHLHNRAVEYLAQMTMEPNIEHHKSKTTVGL